MVDVAYRWTADAPEVVNLGPNFRLPVIRPKTLFQNVSERIGDLSLVEKLPWGRFR